MITFSRENSNYIKENMVDMLLRVPSMDIQELINHSTDKITVMGDIHRSQFEAGNINNCFWFKITGTRDGKDVLYIRSMHLYVCFRQYYYDNNGNVYLMDCINPPEQFGTDIADISNLYGHWELRKITYGH